MKRIISRWKKDCYDTINSPFTKGIWKADAQSRFDEPEFYYSAWIIFLSVLVGCMVYLIKVKVLNLSTIIPQSKNFQPLAQLVGIPIQYIIHLTLCGLFLWISSALMKAPKRLIYCFNSCLKIMSIYPFLQILNIHPAGSLILISILCLLTIKTASNVLAQNIQRSSIFFITAFVMLIAMQLQSLITPPKSMNIDTAIENKLNNK